jgi:hypothetical protein
VRAQVIELTAAGVGVRRIAEALSIAPQSVRAIRALAWKTGKLDHEKQRLGRDYLAVADLLRAEALERIEDIPPQVLLLASAQAADKGQLLTGGATERVERTARVVDLDALIAELPAASPVIEGASAPHKEPDAPADRKDLEADTATADQAQTDSPSDEDHA